MARIALIEPDHAPPEVKEIYEQKLKGKPGNAQKALAHSPDMLKNFLGFYASVGRSLDRKLYELIYIRTSMINGCQYCLQHHLASSKRAGLTPDAWKALQAGDYSRFTDKERTAVAYSVKAYPRSAFRERRGLHGAQATLQGCGDCRFASADRPRESDQSLYGSAGIGSRVPGRADSAVRRQSL
jgi:AhpD family alkylhydroperoxidase